MLKEYIELVPGIQKVYIIPKMPEISEDSGLNNYLYLLNQEIIDHQAEGITLESFSFFNPLIVLKKFLGEKSLIHHHWYEFPDMRGLLIILWKTFWMIIYRLAGAKIIWTVHNQYPHLHKYRKLNIILRKLWTKIPNKLHVHCRSAIDIMSPILNVSPDKFIVFPHPDYPVKIVDKSKSVSELNRKYFNEYLSSSKTIFLMFGYVAEYKGILEVVRTFKRLKNNDKVLIIAGAPKRGNEKYISLLKNEIQDVENIYTYFDLIPEKDISLFYNATDYVVFNYHEILSSGSVVLAMNYQKKIILSPKGCLKELKKTGGKNITFFHDIEELYTVFQICK